MNDDDKRRDLDSLRHALRARDRLARGEWGFAPVTVRNGSVGA